jgi:hypothetical protein
MYTARLRCSQRLATRQKARVAKGFEAVGKIFELHSKCISKMAYTGELRCSPVSLKRRMS